MYNYHVSGLMIRNNEPLRVACLTLINALTSCPEDLDFRMHLRNEFMRVGLIDVLEVIFVFCLNIYSHFCVSQALEDDPGEELELQLKIFFEHKEEDFDEFAQR